ncbi:hypothetical protein AgCh_032705 [Apium graveolens]
MNRTELPIRKRLENVPQFSGSVDAAVAEGNGTRDNPDPRPQIWGCYKFYTLDELDELDQSMAYLARKFSNIRVKKPRSKIRCYNCDELGQFATECRKPKKAKKDKAYLELEAKYEALLKK